MKKLSRLARVELGIEEMLKGKLWAYVSALTEHGHGLGIAVANEPGYHPIPVFWALAEYGPDASKAMGDHADELNAERGMDHDTAFRIIASTMGGRAFYKLDADTETEGAA